MRYRIEQKGHPYRYVKSVASALKVLVERYPGYRDHVGQFRRALRAGQAAVVVGSSVELLKIVPCKDLAPCPKCGQPMTGLGDECLDCEANYQQMQEG